MILTAIMDALKAAILFLIGLFPSFPDMSSLLSHFDTFFGLYQNVDSFVSVNLIGTCIVFVIIFSNLELIWAVIIWVIRKIPGMS